MSKESISLTKGEFGYVAELIEKEMKEFGSLEEVEEIIERMTELRNKFLVLAEDKE